MKISSLIIILALTACSSQNKLTKDYSSLGEIKNQDYIDHMASTGADYLAYENTEEIKLGKESILYLESVHERITANNQLLLRQNRNPVFHVIKNKTPFIFSLPGSQFFISSGLIEKYLKSEELFVAALAAEILKSDRNIYEKKQMIPLGFYNIEKMIQLTRLKPETKYKINEWSYFILKRAGYDSTAYLNWIQVQNRNTLDFSLYLGDAVGISREEHYFKNFMANQGIIGVEKKILEANSSKPFYKLLNSIAGNK